MNTGRILCPCILVISALMNCLLLFPAAAADADHLLLSEVVVLDRVPASTFGSQYIEVVNPTGSSIDLSTVYLTDATSYTTVIYYNIVTGTDIGGGTSGDFHCRFPDGAVIAPGDSVVIALDGSSEYLEAYGRLPDYELFEDHYETPDAVPEMREAFPGGIGAGLGSSGFNVPDLLHDGETLVLYHWDGQSDLVQDLDYIVWGTFLSVRADKSGIAMDGPDAGGISTFYRDDTTVTDQQPISATTHGYGGAFRRVSADEGSETASDGNGVTGHDETSENLADTWQVTADQDPPLAPVSGTPPAPLVLGVQQVPAEPYVNLPITVTTSLLAYDVVAGVSLFYRLDGGIFTEIFSVDNGDSTWTCEIPGQSEGVVVDWYLTATGVNGGTVYHPVWAPTWNMQFVVAGPPPPVFTNVYLSPTLPAAGIPTAVLMTFESIHTVADVSLFYRVNGGGFSQVACSDQGDELWYGEIPAQPFGTVVDWYLSASSTEGGVATHPEGAPANFATFTVVAPGSGPVHLLLTEICTQGASAEFIEICNPHHYSVVLDNYYLTDAIFNAGEQYYWRIVEPNPQRSTVGGGDYADFHARFPAGSILAAGDTIRITVPGSDAFAMEYGFQPDYELFEDGAPDAVPDMEEIFPGSINGSMNPLLTNSAEVVILYYWDGQTDLVTDVDIFIWGELTPQTYHAFCKDGVAMDGPDPDLESTAYLSETNIEDQISYSVLPLAGESFYRRDRTEGDEVEYGSNGVNGHDELSEDLAITWATGLVLVSGVGDQAGRHSDTRFSLPSHPNPFSGSTAIRFSLQVPGAVRLTIYDLAGRRVRTLLQAFHSGNNHCLAWDGRGDTGRALSAGTYCYRLETATGVETGKMMLVR